MSFVAFKSAWTVLFLYCLKRVESHGLRAHDNAAEIRSTASHSYLVSQRRIEQLNVTASSWMGSAFTFPRFDLGQNHSDTANHTSARLLPKKHRSVRITPTTNPTVQITPASHPSARPLPTRSPLAQSMITRKPSAQTTTEPSNKPTPLPKTTTLKVPTMTPSLRETTMNKLEPTDEPSRFTLTPATSMLTDQDDTIKEPAGDRDQTDYETESTLVFQGPAFIFGLELNTTSRGEIDRGALSETLASQLHTHLFEELPFKYKLKNVDIDEIQSISLELVRKLKTVDGDEKATKSRLFVVTANTKFSTNSIPAKNQIADIVMATQLDISIFQSSNDGVLKSTTGARIFPLRTTVNAITSQEGQGGESVLQDYSVLIYVFSALGVFLLIAGSTYYRKTIKLNEKNLAGDRSLHKYSRNRGLVEYPNRINNLPSLELNNSSSFVVLSSSENQNERKHTRAKKRSKIGDGVLFIESESASYSDYSLAEDRGLNDQSFACISPTDFAREIAHEVVDEMIDDGFSCGMSTQNSIWHPSSPLQDRDIDIDTVVGDSDSELDGARVKSKAKMRHPEYRKSKGRRSIWQSSRNEKDNKKHQDMELNGIKDEVVFVSTGFEAIDGRMLQSKKQHDIFSVASDDDSMKNNRSRCISPGELADQVIDEIVEEGFDCGLSLSGL